MSVDKELFGDTLPTYLTRFVGRDREIATVLSLLLPGRLVTVCGGWRCRQDSAGYRGGKAEPGGFGRRGAQRSGDVLGAACVVVEPTEVAAAVATGIGLLGQGGDRPLTPIVRALTDRQALLVLDNCEQVSSACREMVSSLLSSCPTVTVLATSRIPLELSAEEVFAVPPMGGEASGSDPFEGDAVALFVDRATAVAGGYALTEHNAKL